MDPYLGEIRMFAGTYAPQGWAFCNGQVLPIRQYTALFSLLGVTYGGDGVSTFALPNLQSRVPVHFGTDNQGYTTNQGQMSGTETVTLNSSQLPAHTHSLNANSAGGTLTSPTNADLAATPARRPAYVPPTGTASMDSTAISPAGGNGPHNNIAPYLGINFIIALQGIYPQRP